MRAAQPGSRLADGARRVREEPDERGQRRGRDEHVVPDDLVVEHELACSPVDRPGSAAELDRRCSRVPRPLLGERSREPVRQLSDAEPRVKEPRVVAELPVVQPDRSGEHVLQLRYRDEAGAPVGGDLARVHPPETAVVGDHEVAADPLAEVRQTELLEVPWLRSVLGEVRLDETAEAVVGHRGRQAEGVRLERIAGVRAIRPDHRTPLDLERVGAQPAQRELPGRGVAQVEEVPCPIEAEAGVLERDRVAARARQALEHPVRHAGPPQVVRRCHARQAGAEDRDGNAGDRGSGHRSRPGRGREDTISLVRRQGTLPSRRSSAHAGFPAFDVRRAELRARRAKTAVGASAQSD